MCGRLNDRRLDEHHFEYRPPKIHVLRSVQFSLFLISSGLHRENSHGKQFVTSLGRCNSFAQVRLGQLVGKLFKPFVDGGVGWALKGQNLYAEFAAAFICQRPRRGFSAGPVTPRL